MKRSTFIKNLIGLYGLPALPSQMVRQYQKIYLLQCFVRGFQFYEGPKIIQQINQSGLLQLVREPTNQHDNCAIALHFNQRKIGYVPRESNEVLAKLMDANLLSLQAEITHVEPKASTWENVHVAIYALKELSTQESFEQYATLSMLETPEYYTLRHRDDGYIRVHWEEDKYSMEAAQDYYQILVDHSEDDSVYDLIHGSFPHPDDFDQAFQESRILIKKNLEVMDEKIERFAARLDDSWIQIDTILGENSYLVANVDHLAKSPGRIKQFMEVVDKHGEKFYEVIFKE
ncbi:HIRAN domain-containing protein [Reichenbachiella agarivorans]|uniref:HIRAN domain-containing protein n=1 Tax=Reichenbachiella agarivorans TaxID=2979464 RepID=A0ABY6CP18_9BACT|nr:HIRAN domain-containing protein [Reichenbachiella agarivorans]UXP31499.1 HIRAN domain-containing protein [Reichenbachiella agarivorans]